MANWDIVIIGGGATGLAAAAAVGRGASCLVIDRMGGGGELMNLGPLHDVQIEETGPDLFARLMEQATEAGAELAIAEVTALRQTDTGWHIDTDGEAHDATAVILATGLAPGTLGLDDEAAFEGMGLSHCAACDGPLYVGEPVVVAGAGRWAVQEARDLAATASHVTLITQSEPPPAADGFTVIHGRITALEGDPSLDAIHVDTAPHRIATQVVFVQTGRHPALSFAPATLRRGEDGNPVTDPALQTNLPRLFATGTPRTLADAADTGRQAAASVVAAIARAVG